MDVEWAKDGPDGELFILQARPETIHGGGRAPKLRMHRLKERGNVLAEGLAVGNAVASGPARVLKDPSEIETFRQGEVLITEITDPDWEPIMKIASAIVTERGGRTSHAAIVARELGIAAVVGTENATEAVKTGEPVTVSCCEGEVGRVYEGTLEHEVTEVDPEAVQDRGVADVIAALDGHTVQTIAVDGGTGVAPVVGGERLRMVDYPSWVQNRCCRPMPVQTCEGSCRPCSGRSTPPRYRRGSRTRPVMPRRWSCCSSTGWGGSSSASGATSRRR